ncbi:hypothetical protein PoB_002296200 [Plakobranchus ocellatus]|uniref:Transferrin n=1 Tax=Plakobranchus ocellatus TaxID=259542 RepID=A0AAV3ZPN1_9GAST|nr:hypothetical protein PoB_002296200 [Plakobranchus ocellatus]
MCTAAARAPCIAAAGADSTLFALRQEGQIEHCVQCESKSELGIACTAAEDADLTLCALRQQEADPAADRDWT